MAAVYDVTGSEGAWRVVQGDAPSLDYATKEAAFEAACAAAMLSIRDGIEVVIRVRGAREGESVLGNDV